VLWQFAGVPAHLRHPEKMLLLVALSPLRAAVVLLPDQDLASADAAFPTAAVVYRLQAVCQ
jgi:hypothetical protein